MQVQLHIQNGSSAGRAIVVSTGQSVQIGRTAWADVAIADDTQMADVHFAVACGGNVCRIHDLSGGAGLLVNDEPTTEIDLSHGDQIVAGATIFVVQMEGAAGVTEAEAGDEAGLQTVTTATGDSGFAQVSEPTAAAICEQCELDDAALAHLDESTTPREFIDLLVGESLYLDAIMFLARALPKREAIGWAYECLQDVPADPATPIEVTAADQGALAACRQWVGDPSEENRRAAEKAAEVTGLATPAGFVAQGTFWSGGSISLPDLPEVLPADHLTGQAIAASLVMASSIGEPDELNSRQQAFVNLGIQVADGELSWEESD